MKRLLLLTYAMISLMLFCSDCTGSSTPEGALLYYVLTGINLVYVGNKLIMNPFIWKIDNKVI